MNRARRRVQAFSLALACVAACAGGCGKKPASEVEAIRASGVLRAAVVETGSRYARLEGKDVVGLEPDLAEYIADALGVKAEFNVCSKEEALKAIDSGEADIALGCINGSQSLSESYQVSTPYGKGYFYAVTRAGDFALTIGAFKDSSLGVAKNLDEETRGSLYGAEGITVREFPSAKEAAEAVRKGEIRAYICYEDQAKALLAEEDLQVQNVTNLDPEEFVILTAKGNQILASGMDTLIRQFLEAE